MTNVVVYVDGSRAAAEALKYAARKCPPQTRVLLLHVVPSAREGALGSGEKLLERSRDLFLSFGGSDAAVSLRLEVGDAVARIASIAEEVNADAIIMSSHDLGAFPRSQVLGRAAEGTVAATSRPVILVFPEGSEVVPVAEAQP